jgi:hypothetical protein
VYTGRAETESAKTPTEQRRRSIAATVLGRGGVDGLALLAPAERGVLDFSRYPFRLSFPDGSGLAVYSFALVLTDNPLLEQARPN